MLSLYLRQIFPPKMLFFVRQKVQISSKILPEIPTLGNFVKFRQKSIFSSRRSVFVISSVFRQKRNPLEPIVMTCSPTSPRRQRSILCGLVLQSVVFLFSLLYNTPYIKFMRHRGKRSLVFLQWSLPRLSIRGV